MQGSGCRSPCVCTSPAESRSGLCGSLQECARAHSGWGPSLVCMCVGRGCEGVPVGGGGWSPEPSGPSTAGPQCDTGPLHPDISLRTPSPPSLSRPWVASALLVGHAQCGSRGLAESVVGVECFSGWQKTRGVGPRMRTCAFQGRVIWMSVPSHAVEYVCRVGSPWKGAAGPSGYGMPPTGASRPELRSGAARRCGGEAPGDCGWDNPRPPVGGRS
jgi:hypothetical protein